MSASYEFTIWYPELKATALIRRLKTEGTTVENELEKALESLFEQYIPEPDRTSILAALLEADARQAEELYVYLFGSAPHYSRSNYS